MADEGKTELKINFRIQGNPNVAVEQEYDRMRHQKTSASSRKSSEERCTSGRLADQFHVKLFQLRIKGDNS